MFSTQAKRYVTEIDTSDVLEEDRGKTGEDNARADEPSRGGEPPMTPGGFPQSGMRPGRRPGGRPPVTPDGNPPSDMQNPPRQP